MSEGRRIDWIDVARGLGIILVVLGHIVDYGKPLFIWIYSFHMALFFFISGMLFNPQRRINYKRLLVPGFITLGVAILITMLIPEWRAGVTIKGVVISLYSGVFSQFHVNPIWFLFCLAWSEMIMQWVMKRISFKRDWKMGMVFVVTLAIAAVCVKYGFRFVSKITDIGILYNAPMCIGTTLLALIFLFMGYTLKEYVAKLEFLSVDKLLVAAMGCFVIGGIAAYANGNVNLGRFKFNNMPLYLLSSISGGGVIAISIAINKSGIGNILKWLGQRTLVILCVHMTLGEVLLYFIGEYTGNRYTMNLIGDNRIKGILFGVYLIIFLLWKYLSDRKRIAN